jgi:hypothetical protein
VFAQAARAQEVSAYLGLGSAYVSSNGSRIDTFSDGTLHKTPNLDGVFADLGASVFINRHVGFGAELAWKPSQGDYAGLLYRPSFYNFDAIYNGSARRSFAPASEERACATPSTIKPPAIKFPVVRTRRISKRTSAPRAAGISRITSSSGRRWTFTT